MKNVNIIALIPTGKKNAVHLDVLAQIADLHPRAVKKIIKNARRSGAPILSGIEGYWIGTKEEQAQFLQMMKKQALARLKTIGDMQKNAECLEGDNNASVQS